MIDEVDLKFSEKEVADTFWVKIKNEYGTNIAGLDEVGRGPLSGPVVVCCVVLPPNHNIVGIKDSKKLSPKKRQQLSKEIMEISACGFGVSEAEEIDSLNIHQAIRKAAVRAITDCERNLKPDFVLCDGGLDLKNLISTPTTSVIKGDQWFECIAAASIVAKVYHDEQMAIYNEIWPEYGFISNQGYSTQFHVEAIRKYGISPIHRRSFGVCRNAPLRSD